MAQQIARQHSGTLRWCEEMQKWLVSDRKPGVWLPDTFVDHRRKALASAQEQKKANPKSKVTFDSVRHTNNGLTLAKPFLSVSLAAFDTDPWLLNTPAGVVDLRIGKLRSWATDDLFMLQTAVAPDDDWDPTRTQLWISHLKKMTHGNVEIMELLRRLAGMSLIGSQNLKPHIAPQLNGRGRNGKGVFLQGIIMALGDYAKFASTRLLTARENEHTTEQASLKGRRFVGVEEIQRVNAALFKDLTGGGTKQARKMRQDDTTFVKSWTLWFNNNGPLMFAGDTSDGLWSRVPRIDLGEGIPEGERDDEYAESLKAEGSGILAWALQGCREFLSEGLLIPESVRAATQERRLDADPLGMFVNEFYLKDADGKVLGSDFVQMYATWARERDERSGGMKTVYDELRTRFNLKVRPGAGNKTYIFGLKVKPPTKYTVKQRKAN